MNEGYLYCRNCKTAFMYKGIGDQSHCVKCDENSVIEITKDVADELLSLTSELDRLREKQRWIPVSERLPEIIEKDGRVNVVFTKYKPGFIPECGSEYSTSNTSYINAHPERYESWMYPPQED